MSYVLYIIRNCPLTYSIYYYQAISINKYTKCFLMSVYVN
jgi:hypothetical protein